MKNLLIFILIMIATFFTDLHAEEKAIRLTLDDAVKMAVERNLDVRAELYNVAQFEADMQRSRAIYDPTLKLQANYSYSPIGLTNTADSATSGPNLFNPLTNDYQTTVLDSSLSQLLWTGGTIAAVFNNTYTSATFPDSDPTSYWQTNFGVAFTQPLLKNFGRENTELNIVVSRLSKFASLEHFKNRLASIVSQVRTEYFRLFSLREALEARKVSLELARKILNDTKSRVKAGVVPALEVLNAEFGVASREKDLNDAEKMVFDQADILRSLLQLPADSDILIADAPERGRLELDEAEKIERALNRYDIKELKKNLEVTELQSRIYRNNTLPDLSLSATTFLTSLDAVYLGNIDKSPAWSIGLTLTYPIGNSSAENEYRKSRLKTEQTNLQIKSLEDSAIRDVRAAIRAINSNFKQIEVTERGRAFAEGRLRSFIRKNEVGLATTKDVLDAENDLMIAKNNQIQALVDYNNSITRIFTVTGELSERAGIRIMESDADNLYKDIR